MSRRAGCATRRLGLPLLAPLLAAPVVLGAAPALAVAAFVTAVPNGEVNSCLTCHLQEDGGEGWNDFGKDALEAGGANPDANPDNQNLGYSPPGEPPVWSDLCDLDSDGDGYANGEELGDPTCTWTAGDDDPAAESTNPGDAEDFPGGDGSGGVCSAAASSASTPAALALIGLLCRLRRRRVVSSRLN